MHVVATRTGLYGSYREVGDDFHLTDKTQFSSRWMLDLATPEGKKFLADARRTGEAKPPRQTDAERIASGGVQEALALAVEETRALKSKIAELEAELAVLRDRAAPAPTKAPDPAEKDEDEDEDDEKRPAPVRVRRRLNT